MDKKQTPDKLGVWNGFLKIDATLISSEKQHIYTKNKLV